MSRAYRVVGANHFGITVSDIDRTRRFFIDVLGFIAGQTVDLDLAFSEGVTGVTGAVIRVAFVDGPGVTIELVQYLAPIDRTPAGTFPNDVGSAHVAFFVDDVEAIVTTAIRAGWRLAGTIQPIVAGPRTGGKAAYIRDADGTTLELVQRP